MSGTRLNSGVNAALERLGHECRETVRAIAHPDVKAQLAALFDENGELRSMTDTEALATGLQYLGYLALIQTPPVLAVALVEEARTELQAATNRMRAEGDAA